MFKKILLGTSLLCAAAISNAAVMTDTQFGSVALTETDWVNTISVADFDTSLGTLTGVEVRLTGAIEGTITVTNTGPSTANVEGTLSANINYSFGVLTGSVSPAEQRNGILDANGVLEFLNLSDSKMDSAFPVDFAAYTDGVANEFNVSASARSTAFGAGNALTEFVTNASALIEIIYTYETASTPVPVSAPSHLALLGLGLIGFAGARRLRK